MGTKNGGYNADFPVGSQVQIADLATLEHFRATWKYHDPLTEKQLKYAGRIATVKSVGFYFGGDELYTLKGIPGIWHEINLHAAPGGTA